MGAARWLETDSAANVNISAATAIGAYTADADRIVMCQALVDQAAGGGDYVLYATLQVGGAGSSYVLLPKSTLTAAAGETALGGQSGWVNVRAGDVLTVYIDGLAGDTTTPDVTVRWFEDAALRPTAADRTLDVAATGEAGIDLTNRLDTVGILPSAAAGAAGGLPVLGSNAALTCTVNGLTSAAQGDVRAAVGLAAADLDAQLAALSAAALAELVEGTLTVRQVLQIGLAVLAGKASGGGTTSIAFRDQGDTLDRVVATVDASGNRSAVVLDVS